MLVSVRRPEQPPTKHWWILPPANSGDSVCNAMNSQWVCVCVFGGVRVRVCMCAFYMLVTPTTHTLTHVANPDDACECERAPSLSTSRNSGEYICARVCLCVRARCTRKSHPSGGRHWASARKPSYARAADARAACARCAGDLGVVQLPHTFASAAGCCRRSGMLMLMHMHRIRPHAHKDMHSHEGECACLGRRCVTASEFLPGLCERTHFRVGWSTRPNAMRRQRITVCIYIYIFFAISNAFKF